MSSCHSEPDRVKNIEDVSEELDQLLLRSLNLTEELMRSKLQLEESTRSGFWNVAKSRYIMGPSSVCATQLPSEEADVSSRKTVVTSLESTENDVCFTKFNLSDGHLETTNKDNTNALKRRGLNIGESELIEVKDTKPQNVTDPIRWFGVLVPQTLRQAQSSFQLAVELCVQSANVQSELEEVTKRYKTLLSEKIILSSTPEAREP